MRRIRKYVLLASGIAVIGCSPSGSREELGTIVYEIPRVPGADVPYEIPAMGRGESPGGASPTTPPPADPQ